MTAGLIEERLMPPTKPEVCLDGDAVAVFLGADYKHLTIDQVETLIRKLQSSAAILRRKQKRDRREQRRLMTLTEHAA